MINFCWSEANVEEFIHYLNVILLQFYILGTINPSDVDKTKWIANN